MPMVTKTMPLCPFLFSLLMGWATLILHCFPHFLLFFCCKATTAPFALDPKSAMDKPLAGEILLSKEQYAEQAQVNFRNAREAYKKQKSKTQKVVHIC